MNNNNKSLKKIKEKYYKELRLALDITFDKKTKHQHFLARYFYLTSYFLP